MNSKDFLKIMGLTNIIGDTDEDLIVKRGGENDKYIHIEVEKKYKPVYCPNCNERMYSKGPIVRHVKHPILQNEKIVIIDLKQRKLRCTNKACNTYLNEEFSFVEKFKHISCNIPYLILNDLKEVTLTCASVSRRYQVSDTYVHNIMMTYVDFKPLKLSDVISIDEVYLDIDYDSRYVVIISDFITGDIIEVLPNRNDDTLRHFFLSYSREERLKVKYIVSDAYNAYLNLPKRYFPFAKSVIDSFHIVQIIEKSMRKYINDVKKRYQKMQEKERKESNLQNNKKYKTRKDSQELYLLKNHDWVLLCKPGNEPDIDSRHYSKQLGIYPTVERISKMFMALDPNFEVLKELRDKYLFFNEDYVGKVDEAPCALKKLIEEYKASKYPIFKEFGQILEKRFDEIVLSFTIVKIRHNDDDFYRRLSNGPMEGFNRKPKDMKRLARGFSNFDYVRNRILWSSRKDAAILAIPKHKGQTKK